MAQGLFDYLQSEKIKENLEDIKYQNERLQEIEEEKLRHQEEETKRKEKQYQDSLKKEKEQKKEILINLLVHYSKTCINTGIIFQILIYIKFQISKNILMQNTIV